MQSIIIPLLASLGGAGSAATDATAKIIVALLQLCTTGGVLGVLAAIVYHVAVSRTTVENLKRTILAELARMREENAANADWLEDTLERHIEATTDYRLEGERWKGETEVSLALLRQRVAMLETGDALPDFEPLNKEAA